MYKFSKQWYLEGQSSSTRPQPHAPCDVWTPETIKLPALKDLLFYSSLFAPRFAPGSPSDTDTSREYMLNPVTPRFRGKNLYLLMPSVPKLVCFYFVLYKLILLVIFQNYFSYSYRIIFKTLQKFLTKKKNGH